MPTLRVAAAQMQSAEGDIAANLEHATHLAEQAAARGAQLVLFPELMPTGYAYSSRIWDCAEPRNGPTDRWVCDTARRLGIWLATTFLEAEGDDFFNTLVLAAPDGREAGRSRKQDPAGYEAWFFRGAVSSHVIDTEIGRIGVGICMDNQRGYLPSLFQQQNVDIVLQPHSWVVATEPSPLQRRRDLEGEHALQRALAPHFARLLGVPAIFTNKVGPWVPSAPSLWPLPPAGRFPGYATIADSDGTAVAQAESEEGVVVADVVLDRSRRNTAALVEYGRWSVPGPPVREAVAAVGRIGERMYALNRLRRLRAREVSSGARRH